MPQLDSTEVLLHAVRDQIDALELLCAAIERAMMGGQWEDLGTALADSRRVQHALENAMHDARDVRSESFDAEAFQRLRRIFAVRENQMVRLRQYQDTVSDRLAAIARFKSAARRIGSARTQSRLGALDQLS